MFRIQQDDQGYKAKCEHLQSCCGFGHHPNSKNEIEDIMNSKHFEWAWAKNYVLEIRAKSEYVTSVNLILTFLNVVTTCCCRRNTTFSIALDLNVSLVNKH